MISKKTIPTDNLIIITTKIMFSLYPRKSTALSVQYGVTRISNDGLNTIPVEKVIYHPDYVPGNGYVNDVALLKVLSTSFIFKSTLLTYYYS